MDLSVRIGGIIYKLRFSNIFLLLLLNCKLLYNKVGSEEPNLFFVGSNCFKLLKLKLLRRVERLTSCQWFCYEYFSSLFLILCVCAYLYIDIYHLKFRVPNDSLG